MRRKGAFFYSEFQLVMLTAQGALALFILLALASLVYAIAHRFRLPYTVLLTLLGIFLVPISSFGPLDFLREFKLTPELLFYIFLPTLLFETAYNMRIRRVVDEAVPILLLAVFGYLVSAFAIGGGLWFALGLIGLEIPFLITLLFGALISATDPVAVMALFKEYGAPRRLTLIFEGESVANDATALALFLVVLGLIERGISGLDIFTGGLVFLIMLIGGTIVGLLVGSVFVRAIGFFRENEIVAVTLMIVLAHLTFLIAETANHLTENAGLHILKFSPIIATAVASIFMGNYGRFKITPRAEEFVEKFWTQFAFMANSIVFILVGLLFASVPQGALLLTIPVILAVLVVALARALSIYGLMIPFNFFARKERVIPASWQHLLAWGSLRGALAVMLVLLIPEHLTFPGWTLDISVRDFLLVLTVSCIFVTLFIKAPLVGPLMRRLRVDALTPLEKAAEEEAVGIIHGTMITKLKEFVEKGYVPADIAERMITEHERQFRIASEKSRLEGESPARLTERVLQLYLIGLEKKILKELLSFDEVTEYTFKQIYGKLTLQEEATESGKTPDPSRTHDPLDIFENTAEFVRSLYAKTSPEKNAENLLLYYRAQSILARKVLKELKRFSKDFENTVFSKDLLSRTLKTYEQYRKEAIEKADSVRNQFPDVARRLDETLAARSAFRVEEKYLERLFEHGLLTPKLFIKLKNEFEDEVARHCNPPGNKKLKKT